MQMLLTLYTVDNWRKQSQSTKQDKSVFDNFKLLFISYLTKLDYSIKAMVCIKVTDLNQKYST